MDCRTAEGMINQYISGDLTRKELESFMNHIETCSSCYDELETYFIVHEATKQLDQEEKDFVYDFKGLLEADIRQTKKEVRRNKILGNIYYFLAGIGITVFFVYFINVIMDLI